MSPERRAKVKAIIESLPLGERQRDLANETLESMTDADADLIIENHERLMAGLPKALDAVRRIRQGRTT